MLVAFCLLSAKIRLLKEREHDVSVPNRNFMEIIEPFVGLINGSSDFGMYSYSESVGMKQVPDDAFAEISEP